MDLFFKELQNKLKRERKEKFNTLIELDRNLGFNLNRLGIVKTENIPTVDYLRNLAEKGMLKDLGKEDFLILLESLLTYINYIRGIISDSIKLTQELDLYQDIQENAFRELGEQVNIVKEPEELINRELTIMEKIKLLYMKVKTIVDYLIEDVDTTYMENILLSLLKDGKISTLSKEKLHELLYNFLLILKNWLLLMITTLDRVIVLEFLINSNDIEISKFLELKEFMKQADDNRFSDFMNQLMG